MLKSAIIIFRLVYEFITISSKLKKIVNSQRTPNLDKLADKIETAIVKLGGKHVSSIEKRINKAKGNIKDLGVSIKVEGGDVRLQVKDAKNTINRVIKGIKK